MDTGALFQRTESGRDTIRTKAIKLTQSERLLLIIIDGATPYGVLRKEVWALSEERFDRALATLLREGLIFEVLFPVQEQKAEELDSTVVERFLQQDPLDPVTIISFDPEDEFGTDDSPVTTPAVAVKAEETNLPNQPLEVAPPEGAPVVEVTVAASENIVALPVPSPERSGLDPVTESIPELTSTISLEPLTELAVEDEDLTPPSLFQTPPVESEPVPVPISVERSMNAAENLPDNWPEQLLQDEEEGSENTERVHWAYWLALVSGVLMLAVSLISRSFR